jgi:exodeoxyribonuclease VII small subunit
LLEKVVSALEQEGTPLESGTKLYVLGNTLAKRCSGILDATEEKMSKLLGDAENMTQEPFDPEKDGRN